MTRNFSFFFVLMRCLVVAVMVSTSAAKTALAQPFYEKDGQRCGNYFGLAKRGQDVHSLGLRVIGPSFTPEEALLVQDGIRRGEGPLSMRKTIYDLACLARADLFLGEAGIAFVKFHLSDRAACVLHQQNSDPLAFAFQPKPEDGVPLHSAESDDMTESPTRSARRPVFLEI